MVIANCLLCFSIGNGLRRTGHLPQLLLNSSWSILELLGFSSKSIVVHQSSVLHLLQCAPIFSVAPSTVCTNLQCCAFYSVQHLQCCAFNSVHQFSVLLHLLATVLRHVIMLLYNPTSSTILLPMRICLVDYLTASLKSKFLQLHNISP